MGDDEMKTANKESQLKIDAMERASQLIEAMRAAKTNPIVKIEGEALSVYNELEEWGWFENFPIEDEKHDWIYRTMLAMTQYRHLRWAKDHPPKPQKSKWEVVMGKNPRR
jgi:hypothetical protein